MEIIQVLVKACVYLNTCFFMGGFRKNLLEDLLEDSFIHKKTLLAICNNPCTY